MRKKQNEEDQIKMKKIKSSENIVSDEELLFDCMFLATKNPWLGYLYIIKNVEYDIFYA